MISAWSSSAPLVAAAPRLTLATPRRKGHSRPASRGLEPPLPPLNAGGVSAGIEVWARNGANTKYVPLRPRYAAKLIASDDGQAPERIGKGAMSFRRGSGRRNRQGQHRLRRARPAAYRRRTPTAVHDRSADGRQRLRHVGVALPGPDGGYL